MTIEYQFREFLQTDLHILKDIHYHEVGVFDIRFMQKFPRFVLNLLDDDAK